MMPGLSLDHIVILGIIALVVVGPKDLPLLLRKLGTWTAKLRGMAQEFRTGFDELARQAELDELKKEVDALRRTTNLNAVAPELTKPLGTLESYAGVSPPPPVVEPPHDDTLAADREPSGSHAADETSASEDARSSAPATQTAP